MGDELPSRRFTLMVVPEGGRGEVRQLTLSLAQLRLGLGLAGGVVLLALLGVFLVLTDVGRRGALNDALEQNQVMKARFQDMERTLDEVDDTLRRLRLYDTQLQGLPGVGLTEIPVGDDLDNTGEDDALQEEVPAGQDATPDAKPDEDTGAASPAAVDGQGGDDVPRDLSAPWAWVDALADRATRTLTVLHHVAPAAGRLAETAEEYRTMRASLPSRWPVDGVLTSGFGYRRSPITHTWKFHTGLDIAAPRGTVVVAPADGVVSKTDRHRNLGLYLEIDHGYGVTSRMGHHSRLLVQTGDHVRRGEAVALVGTTGRTTGPHVHYEILIHGERTDPLLYLPQRDGR